MATPNSHAATITALGKLIAGLQKHPPSGALVIDGKTYTTAEVVSALQAIIDALNAAVSTRAAFLEAAHTSETTVEDNRVFVTGLRQIVQIQYGQAASILSDFGLTPRKTASTTPDVKVAAAAKAKATRDARGTKGSKQKAAITGNVTSVEITSRRPSPCRFSRRAARDGDPRGRRPGDRRQLPLRL
jgi:hypothetical protein